MKSNVMPSIVQIEANDLKQLVTEVRETVATDAIRVQKPGSKRRVFGIVDLWNIRRGMRTASLAHRRSI